MRAHSRLAPGAVLGAVLGAMLGLAACEPRGEAADPMAADGDVGALCAGISNTFACARRVEEARLGAGAQGVRRVGDSLVLAIADGEPLVLADSVDEHGVGVRYSYQGHLPRLGWYIVHVQAYEGDGFLLVNRSTGEEYPLDARPIVAPGGGRLATASFDLEAGYTANALRILGANDDSVWVIWEVEPDEWGPVDARWASSTSLLFTRRHVQQPGVYADTAAVVSFTGEGWQIGAP